MSRAINPDMISLARESRLLTQTELARRLSIPQGQLSKIESGVIQIPDDLLPRIAQTLEYPVGLFSLSDRTYGLGPSVFFHRKRQSLSPRQLKYIHAQVNLHCIRVAKLLEHGSIETRIEPLDIEGYEGDVEEIARTVRASWLIPPGPIHSVTRAIESSGGIVIRMDFGTHRLDATSLWAPGLPPMFFVNEQAPTDRLRFTLSHELAHIVMHRSMRPDIKAMESEADRFAAEFLMPAKEIKASLTVASLPKLAALKPYWKTSMGAMIEHAYRLGKISPRKRQLLWTQMSHAGYRTREPIQLDSAMETPTLLQEIINAYRQQLQYSFDELGKAVGLFEREFRSLYSDTRPKLSMI